MAVRALVSSMTYSLVQTTLGRGDATPAFERITNGTFDSDLTGWTASSASWSVNYGGSASLNDGGYLEQEVFIQAGRAYTVSLVNDDSDYSGSQPTLEVVAYSGATPVQTLVSALAPATDLSPIVGSGVIEETVTSIRVVVADIGDAFYVTVDDVSLIA